MLHPRQVPNLPTDPDMYPLMFPQNVHAQSVESGDWVVYKASPVEDTHIFDIHRWWDSMKERLPTMYAYAIQTLCITHTSCYSQHTFSVWNIVRSEKQYSMQHGLHKANVSFGFNGFVNAP